MRDMALSDGRVGRLNRLVAGAVALVCFFAILVFGVPGLDPAMWNEVAAVAGLRPPQTVFPGFWRFLAGWAFPLFGEDWAIRILSVVGAAVAAICVYSFYMIVRQILALVVRFGRHYPVWSGFIAPFFAGSAALAFGLSDPLWQTARIFSPAEIRLLLYLGIVQGLMRWFTVGGRWRLFVSMTAMGVMAAETPFAFLFPLGLIAAYVSVWHCVMDGLFPKPEGLPEPEEMPKWRMFFLFLGGLAVAVWLNASAFVALGGVEANGWELEDIYFRYAGGYWHVFADAATIVGWGLGLCFAVLPFVVSIRMAPLVVRDDRQMPFNFGVIMFFVGVLATMQIGAFPSCAFWTFSQETVLVESSFLLVFFVFCAMVAFALFGAAFAFECQRVYLVADEGIAPPGKLLKGVAPAVAAVLLVLVLVHVPKPVETEMQRIVDEAVEEIVEECGDAEWLFTDGHLDAAVELSAARRGKTLRTLNMMSGDSPWEESVRTRGFKPDSEDFRAAQTGVPGLLRIWAGEKTNGLDGVALQLGFEIWKRERRPLPKVSGMIARAKGMDDAAAKAGIERSEALAKRILALAPKTEKADPSPALANAFSAVNWRLSRFARLREDSETADSLDLANNVLKRMVGLIEQERLRAFMQMTPGEGLQIALRRADFAEARRYATIVLNRDEENPEANFAMGMGELTKGRLKEAEGYLLKVLARRPNEPAVLNNLSIIVRKQGRYKEAEDYARRAIKLLPNVPEVKKTLSDALKHAP